MMVAAAAAGYAYWQARSLVNEFHAGAKQQVVDAVEPELDVAPSKPSKVVPELKHAMTFLVIGSDARASEQGRSDTMLLVRVDPDTQQASMMTIPRDLRVPIPGHGTDKINAAYSWGGAKLLTATIREYFGVKIDHFFQVDFQGFADIVDELGGVYVSVDGRYLHVNDGSLEGNWSSIDIKPGYQKLSASDALAFVRFRHLDSDFVRAARQQLFLREVGREIRERQASITKLPSLLHAIAKAITSDLAGVTTTVKLANTLRSIPPENIRRVTLQADSEMLGGVYYLVSSDTQRDAALAEWSLAARRATTPAPTTKTSTSNASRPLRPRSERDSHSAPSPSALTPDGGQGLALVKPLVGLRRCAPGALPVGYTWPATDAGRRYTLHGHPADALYATAGSGRSVLFMFTTWQDPPILQQPTYRTTVAGKRVEVWKDSGKVRQVAWHIGSTRAWITNTLTNELSSDQMLAMVAACHNL